MKHLKNTFLILAFAAICLTSCTPKSLTEYDENTELATEQGDSVNSNSGDQSTPPDNGEG